MIAARALFSFLHGEARPSEQQLVGALLVSEAIHSLRILSLIETKRVEAEAKASRKRRR